MKTDLKLFTYHFIDNSSDQTLFLYHGTGGSETDLLPLIEPFRTTHNIVGLLGNVREHGMARFFARQSDGVLDQDSIQTEVKKLTAFIKAWSKHKKTANEDITHIGYSNGANMILSTLFFQPELMYKVALLHPMLPFTPKPTLDLSAKQILLSWSPDDQVIPANQSLALIETLTQRSANVELIETEEGHALTQPEISQLENFIKED